MPSFEIPGLDDLELDMPDFCSDAQPFLDGALQEPGDVDSMVADKVAPGPLFAAEIRVSLLVDCLWWFQAFLDHT
jgi:hypothetical protein